MPTHSDLSRMEIPNLRTPKSRKLRNPEKEPAQVFGPLTLVAFRFPGAEALPGGVLKVVSRQISVVGKTASH